jgi:hypothetical protein
MNGTHCTKIGVGHVERSLKILFGTANQPCRRLIAIIEEPYFVEGVKLTGLSRNIRRREMEAPVKIVRRAPIDQLSHNLTVPFFVKLPFSKVLQPAIPGIP